MFSRSERHKPAHTTEASSHGKRPSIAKKKRLLLAVASFLQHSFLYSFDFPQIEKKP